MRELIGWCRERSARLVDTTAALARLESPSGDREALARCGEVISTLLTRAGARVERVADGRGGHHLRATIAPRAGGQATCCVMLLGHFDTVWPVGQAARMPIVVEDGRLFGPGVLDMKAGAAIGVAAIEALHACAGGPPCRVVLLLTNDEETGSDTSRALIEREAAACAAVLVLEPALADGRLKTRRKGVGEFEIVADGIAAHAGIAPEAGASAVVEIARQILAVERLAAPDVGVTVNCGMVDGGTRPNVVAERARLLVDVRVTRLEDVAPIEHAMRALTSVDARVRLQVSGGISRPPMERTAGVAWLYDMAVDVGRTLGLDLGEGATGGASDGNFTAALGVPTLDGLGAVGDGAHALHEHVIVAHLPERAALLAGLIEHIAAVT